MGSNNVEDIRKFVQALIELTPQLHKIERPPIMTPLPSSTGKKAGAAKRSKTVGYTSSSSNRNLNGTGAQPLVESNPETYGWFSFVLNRIASTPLLFQAPVEVRVATTVKELEETVLTWLDEWRTRLLQSEQARRAVRERSRASKRQSMFDDASMEMSELEALLVVYQLMTDLLFSYQYYLKYVDVIIQKVLPVLCETFQLFTLKATCQHWFHLPAIQICRVEAVAEEFLKIDRHPVDERFDLRELHTFSRPHEHAIKLMDAFVRKANLTDQRQLPALGSYYASKLTATYPMVPAEQAKNQAIASQTPQEMVLLNDPNNDGILTIVGQNWAVGAVVDGSGSGAHARLCANLFLATLLNMITGQVPLEAPASDSLPAVIQQHTLTDFTVNSLPNIPWKTSHDCLLFLESVCREAQKHMSEVDECGDTTLIAYTLTKMDTDDVLAYRKTSPVFNQDLPTKKDVYVLNYVVAGDTEGYVYSNQREHWYSLQQPPPFHEGIRLNTSITPGGLGKHHGKFDMIFGAYLWPDYIKRKTDNYPRHEWVEFHAHTNNIHFGQCFLSEDDYAVFASDGLGDTLDPIQVFPRPKLILGLEEFDTWEKFGKHYPRSRLAVRDLKEMVLELALSSTMNPYIPNTSNKSESGNTLVGASAVMNACIEHAMTVTQDERDLYFQKEFIEAQRSEKQRIMERRINEWIDKNWKKRNPLASPITEGSYALPGQFVPYAKVDHLGIQVLKPRLFGMLNRN